MPLCTIFEKWPAPTGPAWAKPSSRGPSGRSASKTGMARSMCSGDPPAMRPYPLSLPQMPPETPQSR
jgi:hypothetical protein